MILPYNTATENPRQPRNACHDATHALPQTHRTHLIRSTRKLGAILGETPLLLKPTRGHLHSMSVSSTSSTDSSSSSSSASKRSGRIFVPSVPRSSSLAPAFTPTTFNSTSPKPTAPSSTSASPPPPRGSQAPSPPSHLISPAFSPLTPTFTPPKVDRRKKMAKLTRTLGQNVPPELVFSSARETKRPIHVPALLAALSPAHASLLPQELGREREHEEELASPTREAAGMLRASEYEYVEPRQRGHSSLSYYRSNSSSDEDDWVTIPAPLVASSYPPRSPGLRANSYSPPSPRSPHYCKASTPTWNAARTFAGAQSGSQQRMFAAELQNAELQDTPGVAVEPTSPPAHPSTTSRSSADARFLSRHYEVVLPWVEHSRSASPVFFQGRSASPARSQSPAPSHAQAPSRAQTALSYNSSSTGFEERANTHFNKSEEFGSTYRKEAGWSGEREYGCRRDGGGGKGVEGVEVEVTMGYDEDDAVEDIDGFLNGRGEGQSRVDLRAGEGRCRLAYGIRRRRKNSFCDPQSYPRCLIILWAYPRTYTLKTRPGAHVIRPPKKPLKIAPAFAGLPFKGIIDGIYQRELVIQ
ncbi:hypothetical protein C8R43DRAFT_1200490 [Mycena crocata]|nr:hypothetical protein C8R43DRAFT_1200490 [Mycena crocata]